MNQKGKNLARIGVLLQLGLLIGFGVTLVGMMMDIQRHRRRQASGPERHGGKDQRRVLRHGHRVDFCVDRGRFHSVGDFLGKIPSTVDSTATYGRFPFCG